VSSTSVTYLVIAFASVFGLAAFTAFVLVPAWSAYTRLWERMAATFLSLYVLATLVALGMAAGGGVIWVWDRVG
jgi:hypothetical protein